VLEEGPDRRLLLRDSADSCASSITENIHPGSIGPRRALFKDLQIPITLNSDWLMSQLLYFGTGEGSH